MNGFRLKDFCAVLEQRFTRDELERALLFELDVHLDSIVAPNLPDNQTFFDVAVYFQKEGRLAELVRGLIAFSDSRVVKQELTLCLNQLPDEAAPSPPAPPAPAPLPPAPAGFASTSTIAGTPVATPPASDPVTPAGDPSAKTGAGTAPETAIAPPAPIAPASETIHAAALTTSPAPTATPALEAILPHPTAADTADGPAVTTARGEAPAAPTAPERPKEVRGILGAPLRFSGLKRDAREAIEPQDGLPKLEIDLCLSGGGIRAALFHLGLLYYLSTVQQLDQVRRISSVSGGSILAAHFAMRRDEYVQHFTGENDVARRPAFEFVEFAQGDLRGRVVRRWAGASLLAAGVVALAAGAVWRWGYLMPSFPLVAWAAVAAPCALAAWLLRGRLRGLLDFFSRIKLLERGYDIFLSRRLLRSSAKLFDHLAPPEVMDLEILSTSLTAGVPVSFSHQGIRIHSQPAQPVFKNSGFPVARAVTASSAFPAAFPPVFLSKTRDLGRTPNDNSVSDHFLSDGGIYDNLGINSMVAHLAHTGRRAQRTILIVSDAGLPFEGDAHGRESAYGSLFLRAMRTTDVQMNRLSLLDMTDAKNVLQRSRQDVEVLTCQTSEEVAGSDVEELQASIRRIRTDLNSFSAAEVHVLVRHGYQVARKICTPYFGEGQETHPGWSPLSPEDLAALSLGQRGAATAAVGKLKVELENSDRVRFLQTSWWKDRWGTAFLVLAALPWLALAWLLWHRPLLPSPLTPGIQNVQWEKGMQFPQSDLREEISTWYKDKPAPAQLCYFEIPIQFRCRGRQITIAYGEDDPSLSDLTVHAFRKTAAGLSALPGTRPSENPKMATVTVPDCRPGDTLVFFVVVNKPRDGSPADSLAPFRVR